MNFNNAPNAGRRATFIFFASLVLALLFGIHQGWENTLVINSDQPSDSYTLHNHTVSVSKVAIPFGNSKRLAVKLEQRKDGSVELTEEEWQARVEKGNEMLCLLNADIDSADRMLNTETQSLWLNLEDATTFGWTIMGERVKQFEKVNYDPILPLFGLTTDLSDWESVYALHANDYEQDGAMEEVSYLLPEIPFKEVLNANSPLARLTFRSSPPRIRTTSL
jgi:hypothetical protein